MAARASARKETTGLTAGITVMFTPDEKAQIRAAAFHTGSRSQSDFIRSAALKAAKRSQTALQAAS